MSLTALLTVSFIINADPEAEADPEDPDATPMHQMDLEPFAGPKAAASDPTPSRWSHCTAQRLESSVANTSRDNIQYPSSRLSSSANQTKESSVPASDVFQAIFTPPQSFNGPWPPSNLTQLNGAHQKQTVRTLPPALSPTAGTCPTSPILMSDMVKSDAEQETELELAFLLRHFSEVLGKWMDLFDLASYFANYVPVKAMTNPLLRYAAASYSAKQLGRVIGRQQVEGGHALRQSPSETWPDIAKLDWTNKAAQYYDKAIKYLIEALKIGAIGVGSLATDDEQLEGGDSDNVVKNRLLHQSPHSDSPTNSLERSKKRRTSSGPFLSDEMAAATAILCDYELLDNAGEDWIRHLDGTRSLLDRKSFFDLVEGSMMPLHSAELMPRPRISRARQATFWNFARQDVLSALITERSTRLDTEDLPMWKDAGLLINEAGFIQPSNLTHTGLPEANSMKEDMISNALIWIMSKIVNLVVAGNIGPPGRESWESVDRVAMAEAWTRLEKHLESWVAGLPDTFKPCVVIAPSIDTLRVRPGNARSVFTEIWYSMPMCASTMQSYHMARMLLLLHCPQSTTIRKCPLDDRLGSSGSIVAEIKNHARAICGIAVSRPDSAARIHSVQPLFTAGQALETGAERMEVVKLLRAIEHDTGWATAYRVKQLLGYWNWPEDFDDSS